MKYDAERRRLESLVEGSRRGKSHGQSYHRNYVRAVASMVTQMVLLVAISITVFVLGASTDDLPLEETRLTATVLEPSRPLEDGAVKAPADSDGDGVADVWVFGEHLPGDVADVWINPAGESVPEPRPRSAMEMAWWGAVAGLVVALFCLFFYVNTRRLSRLAEDGAMKDLDLAVAGRPRLFLWGTRFRLALASNSRTAGWRLGILAGSSIRSVAAEAWNNPRTPSWGLRRGFLKYRHHDVELLLRQHPRLPAEFLADAVSDGRVLNEDLWYLFRQQDLPAAGDEFWVLMAGRARRDFDERLFDIALSEKAPGDYLDSLLRIYFEWRSNYSSRIGSARAEMVLGHEALLPETVRWIATRENVSQRMLQALAGRSDLDEDVTVLLALSVDRKV